MKRRSKASLRGSSPASRTTRPPLERMIRIHEQLKEGRFPNCSTLAKEFDVSYKTIQRDIDFLRDRWQLPIAYNEIRHGFYYTSAVGNLPTMTVSRGELVALLVAQKAVEQYRGTPFEKPIASAFDKLASSMDEQEGISIHQLAEAFSFKPASLAKGELQSFSKAAEAVIRSQELAFLYQSLQGTKAQQRRLRPYHLGCISDQWYLIGEDPERNALRTFALSRIRRMRETGLTFEKPKDFSIGQVLGGSFAAFEAKETVHVHLRLDSLAARIAAERRWHPSQRITPLPDGGADLTMKVGIAPDLISWILSWGVRAEVLAPLSLRKTIASQLGDAAGIYR